MNNRKIIYQILIMFIIFFLMISNSLQIKAVESSLVEDEEVDLGDIQRELIETSAETEELNLDSRIALIYDRASGRILYEKNGNKQTPMASTTKIITAIVVLENANLKDIVTIDSKAAGIGGSRLGLKKNDKITVNDLLYGLMLRSGNDAAGGIRGGCGQRTRRSQGCCQ